jgi:hypothetical protein
MPSEERSYFTEFEIRGHWWLPETPDRRIHGTLRYSPSTGINIELSARLKEPEWKPGPVSLNKLTSEYGLVLGHSYNGEPCTALRTFEVSASILPIGGARLRVNRLYIGSNFTTEAEIQFSKQDIEFTYLEDWIGFDRYRVQFSGDKTVIEIPTDPSEIFSVQISEEDTNLSSYLTTKGEFDLQGEFAGKRRSWICIRPAQTHPFTWYEDMARRFGFFLTLCVGQPIFPRRVVGELPVPADYPLKPPLVEVYFPLFDGKEGTRISWGTMPVPFSMVRDRVDSVVKAWFSAHKEIEPVIGLLLGTYYNPRMYVETEFLTLIQAVEIYYLRSVGGGYLSVDEWRPHYEAIIHAIPDAIEPGHRASLKNRSSMDTNSR